MKQVAVNDFSEIESLVSTYYGVFWQVASYRRCLGRRLALLLFGPNRVVFAKHTNAPGALSKAKCEAEALRRMAQIPGIRAPEVIGILGTEDGAILVLESVNTREALPEDWDAAAEMIALLHRTSDAEFGLEYNNYIGDFAQLNSRVKTWDKFYAESRLRPMIKLLKSSALVETEELLLLLRVADRVEEVSNSVEKPALLHGDLWPGNVLFDASGPLLIDPAISFGNREMDLAFSQMSPDLSFASSFYERYNKLFPLPEGYEFRKELWQLWPLMVHVLQEGRKWMPQLLAAANKYA